MATKFESAQVDNIVGTYNASVSAGDDYEARSAVLKALANEYKVTDNAIRGKLVAEGVYVKKEVAAKTATGRIDKAALAKAFEAAFGVDLPSITNMTAKDMQAMWDKFVEMSDIRELS